MLLAEESETTMTDKPTVLFVCVHNAGRSQMAAGYLRALGATASRCCRLGPRRRTRSIPSRSRRWPRRASTSRATRRRSSPSRPCEESDVVITMGCGDACPIFPGKRYEDWELDDPAGQGLVTVRRDPRRHPRPRRGAPRRAGPGDRVAAGRSARPGAEGSSSSSRSRAGAARRPPRLQVSSVAHAAGRRARARRPRRPRSAATRGPAARRSRRRSPPTPLGARARRTAAR